jgi:uncharacterized protein (DUF2461 family)
MINRSFWQGTADDGSNIVTMTISENPPIEIEILGTIYRNFIPISKEDVLKRQKEGFEKLKNR